MTEMTLSNNLQQLMRIHGNISVSELARLTGIPQPTIHHILTGSTRNPRKKALEELSRYFSVSINELTGQEPLPAVIPDAVKENLQISTIPVIEWDSLKKWPSETVKTHDTQEILIDKKIDNNSFALVMPDASMEPLFQQNSLLIFDSGKTPKDRDFVIVYLSKEDRVAFNRLFIENNTSYLRQGLEDGSLKLTKLDKPNDRILGTLIEARIQY
ncbi:LexA family protein [Legionella parisiensis]|uniref:Putative HTH-type transcriptional regulator n=1 Tax=Legionella parisiensis TaxID=45071 RepID=A0A1E5JSM1_9GAMM|nr:helix-turn-helix domain-containing protein [Legionella parisiensis]KTD43012.1 HTH-type transcriptional regulator [Legionella parisiensis]OEH47512.1 putative HTH-type transcriptional regulator [Legionella parisiensis]STX77914.1 HTH-type transcriptional regulator [Legionella parisiensis]HEO1393659.1 helix-turn-helix domain-containing protein [Legionella pneumophila]